MAFINHSKLQPAVEITAPIRRSCDDYYHYIKFILEPAKRELDAKVLIDDVFLHQAFSANLILAHSVDYLRAIRSAAGIKETRTELVKSFDVQFALPGANISNRKMELVDAINNALKHIRLDVERYKSVGERYGQISFQSLVEDEGRIMCHLENYRFDYCRVVLLPALKALSILELGSAEAILMFAKGEFTFESWDCSDIYEPDDPSTAIDRMIEICSSPCKNCREEEDECRCSQYVFAGNKGQFEPLHFASEDEIEEIMSHISPSYSRA
jgi:hypothetical protein